MKPIMLPKKKVLNVKRILYQWHSRIGQIILILVMLWALSVLMHPFMTNEPKSINASTFGKSTLLAEGLPQLSLQEVMAQNGLRSLRNFRLLGMDGKLYYQVKDSYNRLQYFDADTGELLPDGDLLYAEYLARYFAEDQYASVSIHLQKEFDHQYRESDRLLPVYRVSFDRPDAMDVYVETEHSRLANYHTQADKAYGWVFNTFHQWAFFEGIAAAWVRGSLQFMLLGILLLSALSGWMIYGLMWKHYKPIKQPVSLLHKYQRQMGLAVSFIMFVFACHGAFHAFIKSKPDDSLRFVKNAIFKLEDLHFDTQELPWERTQAHSASIINMPQGNFYQLFGKDAGGKAYTYYFSTENGEELKEGDFIYARYLANKFKAHKANIDAGVSFSCCLPPDTIPDGTQLKEAGINATALITHFDEEYDFTHKRLPVVKVAYASPETNYFIETASSRLSVIVDKAVVAEDYAFGSLHKFDFPDKLANQNIRDNIAMLSSLAVLFVSLLGFVLYLKL